MPALNWVNLSWELKFVRRRVIGTRVLYYLSHPSLNHFDPLVDTVTCGVHDLDNICSATTRSVHQHLSPLLFGLNEHLPSGRWWDGMKHESIRSDLFGGVDGGEFLGRFNLLEDLYRFIVQVGPINGAICCIIIFYRLRSTSVDIPGRCASWVSQGVKIQHLWTWGTMGNHRILGHCW